MQRALVSALVADGAIRARGLKIYDGPPAEARAPYLSVGADMVSARGWQGGGGHEHRFSVSLWDVREGFAPAKEALADVERVVLAMPRHFAGVRLTGVRLLRATVRRTGRNWTQGIAEFRALSVREDQDGG
nr:DUF3168 domain-containing protein [Sandaracinobacteroides sayramensis]